MLFSPMYGRLGQCVGRFVLFRESVLWEFTGSFCAEFTVRFWHQDFSRAVNRPAGRVRILSKYEAESGRVRRWSEFRWSRQVSQEVSEISPVGSGHSDPARPASSDPTRERPWVLSRSHVGWCECTGRFVGIHGCVRARSRGWHARVRVSFCAKWRVVP